LKLEGEKSSFPPLTVWVVRTVGVLSPRIFMKEKKLLVEILMLDKLMEKTSPLTPAPCNIFRGEVEGSVLWKI
jgi:hypothetical protein